jgi:hypothetical protein
MMGLLVGAIDTVSSKPGRGGLLPVRRKRYLRGGLNMTAR